MRTGRIFLYEYNAKAGMPLVVNLEELGRPEEVKVHPHAIKGPQLPLSLESTIGDLIAAYQYELLKRKNSREALTSGRIDPRSDLENEKYVITAKSSLELVAANGTVLESSQTIASANILNAHLKVRKISRRPSLFRPTDIALAELKEPLLAGNDAIEIPSEKNHTCCSIM